MCDIASEAEKQFDEGHNPLYLFGEKHRRLLDWLDPWVVVLPTGEGTPRQVIFKPQGERHIETNEW